MERTSSLKVTTPTDLEIVMTRTFDAPRRLVWQAMTTPELVQRWMFVPPGWVWTECQMDVRVGGTYRWAWNGPNGTVAMTMWGEHREVNPPAKSVHTKNMEVGPGADGCGGGREHPKRWELLETIELVERGGQTELTMTLQFPSKESRDLALASGWEYGYVAGYDRLEGVLAELN